MRAFVLFEWGRFRDALTWSLRARREGNESPELLRQLGWCYLHTGEIGKALAAMRDAQRVDPDGAASQFALASVLLRLGDSSESATLLERGLSKGDDAAALNLLGGISLESGRLSDAEALVRRAIAIAPQDAASWNNLGIALSRQQRSADAIDAFRRAEELDSDLRLDAFVNLAIELRLVGRDDEALAIYRRCLPRSASTAAFFNYALARLSEGAFDEGWHYNEFRWLRPPLVSMRPSYLAPSWDGQDIEGKTILIRSEQGLGDVIQFLRYAVELKAMGARVLLRPLAGMEAIVGQIPGIDKVVSSDEPEDFDFYVHAMSLPRVLGTRVSSIPAPIPYVFADPLRVRQWSALIGEGAMRVGIVWAGSPTHQLDRFRSIPLQMLSPLASVSGVRLFSLQKGAAADQLTATTLPIVDLGCNIKDFGDTAAILLNLDLVICVDTSVAHLAGAMGRPVWMLNAHPGDWRWCGDATSTPWYPSMRIFRQRKRGAWDPVIADVMHALGRLAASPEKGFSGAGPRSGRTEMKPAPLDPARQTAGFRPMGVVSETRFGIVQHRGGDADRDVAIRWYGEYLSEHLTRIGPLIRVAGTAIEAGASEGLHALAIANKLGSVGHLIAFEDDALLRTMLRQNVAGNGLQNVTVLDGKLEIDALRLEQLDLVKTRGDKVLEDLVKQGMQTLWRLRPALFAAEVSVERVPAHVSVLRDAGYRCWHWRTDVFDSTNFNRRNLDVLAGHTVDAILALPEERSVTLDTSAMTLLEA